MHIASVTTTFRLPYTFERLSDELLCAMWMVSTYSDSTGPMAPWAAV